VRFVVFPEFAFVCYFQYMLRLIQEKLQNALKEKELLIKELNHRVKNNFSVLVSLLRLSKENLQKEKEKILEEFEYQVFSILKVHELLMESEKGTTINVSEYLQKLADEFLASYVDIKDKLQFDIPNVHFEISSKQAVHLGLVVTEIFLNSLKYALLPLGKRFELSLNPLNDKKIEIIVGDDGNAFDFDAVLEKTNSFGLSIIKDMADSSSFDIIYPSKGDSKYKIFISK
jgi:two-component sensor histidine kinase